MSAIQRQPSRSELRDLAIPDKLDRPLRIMLGMNVEALLIVYAINQAFLERLDRVLGTPRYSFEWQAKDIDYEWKKRDFERALYLLEHDLVRRPPKTRLPRDALTQYGLRFGNYGFLTDTSSKSSTHGQREDPETYCAPSQRLDVSPQRVSETRGMTMPAHLTSKRLATKPPVAWDPRSVSDVSLTTQSDTAQAAVSTAETVRPRPHVAQASASVDVSMFRRFKPPGPPRKWQDHLRDHAIHKELERPVEALIESKCKKDHVIYAINQALIARLDKAHPDQDMQRRLPAEVYAWKVADLKNALQLLKDGDVLSPPQYFVDEPWYQWTLRHGNLGILTYRGDLCEHECRRGMRLTQGVRNVPSLHSQPPSRNVAPAQRVEETARKFLDTRVRSGSKGKRSRSPSTTLRPAKRVAPSSRVNESVLPAAATRTPLQARQPTDPRDLLPMSLHSSFLASKDRVKPRKIFTDSVNLETFNEHDSATVIEYWPRRNHKLRIFEITIATTILDFVNKAPEGWSWTFEEARKLLQDMCLADVHTAHFVKTTVTGYRRWLRALKEWEDGLRAKQPQWVEFSCEYNEMWNRRKVGEEIVNAKGFPGYVE